MISLVAYHLQLLEALAPLHNVFHVSLLKPHHRAVPYCADPVVVYTTAAEPGYDVEKNLRSCQCQQNWSHWVEYLVK